MCAPLDDAEDSGIVLDFGQEAVDAVVTISAPAVAAEAPAAHAAAPEVAAPAAAAAVPAAAPSAPAPPPLGDDDESNSTHFSQPEDDPGFKLLDNSEFEQICIDLSDPLWRIEWKAAAAFRPIVTAACKAPPGFKVTEFDVVKYNLDGTEQWRRTMTSGDILRHGRAPVSLHALHVSFSGSEGACTAAGGHLDVLPLYMKGKYAKDKVVAVDDRKKGNPDGERNMSTKIFTVCQLSKCCAHYQLKTLHGNDPRQLFPATQHKLESAYIVQINMVLAVSVELQYLRDHAKLFTVTGLQDLAKWKGSPQSLKLPWLLGNASADIAQFERDKLKGNQGISLSQKNEADKHRMELTLAAQKIFQQTFTDLRAAQLKLPIIPLGLPPVQRGGKRFLERDPAASASRPDPDSPSRLEPAKRNRLSKAQRLRLDKQAEEKAKVTVNVVMSSTRNTRSAAAKSGPSQLQEEQPPTLHTAPPEPAPGVRAPAIAPHAHAMPQDLVDAMQRARQASQTSPMSSPVSSHPTSVSGATHPSSVALTEFHEEKMRSEQGARKLEKEMMEKAHLALIEEKDRAHHLAAQVAAKAIEDLSKRLFDAQEQASTHKANAKQYEAMFQMQKSDHERMFDAMLAKMIKD